MRRALLPTVVAILAPTLMAAGDVPAAIQAKFIKILASNAGSAGKVAVKDAGMQGELSGLGVSNDPGAKVAWATSEGEVTALSKSGKMVICGHLEWLPKGGAIAIVEEGGKPQIYLHMGHIAESGVTLSDAVLKIGKRTG